MSFCRSCSHTLLEPVSSLATDLTENTDTHKNGLVKFITHASGQPNVTDSFSPHCSLIDFYDFFVVVVKIRNFESHKFQLVFQDTDQLAWLAL